MTKQIVQHKIANLAGFTLIQCLVSLSIIVIMTSLSVPNVIAMMTQNTIRSVQERLVQDLRLSRTIAKANSVMVYLCPSKNGLSCENSSQWNTGWIAFRDKNNNKIHDPNEALITRYLPARPLSINISLHAAGRAKKVTINRIGMIRTSGNIRICDADAKQEKIQTIKLNNQGRMAKELRKIACG